MSKRGEAKKRGFDSHFEMDLYDNELAGLEYHPTRIKYKIPASTGKYEPDFKYGNLLIESKGRFRTNAEAQKYVHIAKAAEEQGYKFVFLFSDPDKKMPGARKRKDQTYLTMGEWSDKVSIAWYSRDTIKEILEK